MISASRFLGFWRLALTPDGLAENTASLGSQRKSGIKVARFPIPMSLFGRSTRLVRNGESDASSDVRFADLAPGSYKVGITAGFQELSVAVTVPSGLKGHLGYGVLGNRPS